MTKDDLSCARKRHVASAGGRILLSARWWPIVCGPDDQSFNRDAEGTAANPFATWSNVIGGPRRRAGRCEGSLSMIRDPTVIQPWIRLNERPVLARLSLLFRIFLDVSNRVFNRFIRIEKHLPLPICPGRYRFARVAIIDQRMEAFFKQLLRRTAF